jgi:hypothetical protein
MKMWVVAGIQGGQMPLINLLALITLATLKNKPEGKL